MPLYIKLLHLAFATELHLLTPIIALLLGIGLVTSFFQAAFQIEDATFALPMVFIAMAGGFGLLTGFADLASYFILHAPDIVHASWS